MEIYSRSETAQHGPGRAKQNEAGNVAYVIILVESI